MPSLNASSGTIFILQILVSAFLAILFLQSGIDKVVDRRGNLEFLQGHFAKSPLAGMVPLLATVITILEIASGALSLRARVVNLEDEAPPQQGNTLATGERLAGYAEKGSAPSRCRHAQGVRSGRRESRVHAAQAGCSLVASGNDQILLETEKLRLLDEICSRDHDEKNMIIHFEG